MQIEKTKVVIASTLKPVDDTRMFEKFGVSLADTNKYEVFILGFPSRAPVACEGVTFLSLAPFRRLSLSRFSAAWKIFRMTLAIKPEILIFCTHELLLPAVLYKLILRKKILYDIRENYFRNVLFIPSFHFFLRPLLAVYIRTKEILLSPWVDHFILAEKGYEQELNFVKNKKTVLENKLKKPVSFESKKSIQDGLIHLLFSGTLAETTGVFEAIELSKKLHAAEPRIRLTIIGYCAQHRTLKKIRSILQQTDFIDLKGGDFLVPHHQILKEIQQADAGIISYPPNPSTRNSIPTKLFEYLGNSLPIFLVDHPAWTAYCNPYPACIPVDFKNIQVHEILSRFNTENFYRTRPTDIFWESEGLKLVRLLDQRLPIRKI